MKKIFYNGTIITMERSKPLSEAVVTDDDRIIGVGDYYSMNLLCGSKAERVNLYGKTLLPGFFDAHGHFIMTVLSENAYIDLTCAPIGNITSVKDLLHKLREYDSSHPGKDPIVGCGFDDTLLQDGAMPKATDLDTVSLTRPVIVLHTSMQILSANSFAIKAVGITPNFQPKNGRVNLENGFPDGIFEEREAMEGFLRIAYGEKFMSVLPFGIERTSDRYIMNGITTVCEGAADNETAKLMEPFIRTGKFRGRYIICPAYDNQKRERTGSGVPEKYGYYRPDKLIDGPVKLIMDGSIQNYTAYLSQPYYKSHPTRKNSPGYRGFPQYSVKELTDIFNDIMKSDRSFAIHSNGDAALDDIISAASSVEYPELNKNKRNLVIHCQNASEKQLEQFAALNLLPSFFPSHIYLYGDRHRDRFLGMKRVSRLDPAGDALRLGLKFTLHSDSPVVKCSPLQLVKNAVSRMTSSGAVLGKEQRIPVMAALEAVTINAAYQYGVDDIIGSICVGKKADFTLLDSNPLECEIKNIDTIGVSDVYVDGESVKRKY